MKRDEEKQLSYMEQLDEAFKPKHGITENGEYFTEQDYIELQRNLVLYKDGNQEATDYIVHVFHPFIMKYVKFIKNGCVPYTKRVAKNGRIYNQASPTISSFVGLFMEKGPKETRSRRFAAACYRIRELFNKYEIDDVYNELVLALLNMANKYKITKEGDQYHKKNGTFHMYISKCFHWEAYRFLSKLIEDPIVNPNILSLREQFDDMDVDELCEIFVEDKGAANAFDMMIGTVARMQNIQNSDTVTLKEDRVITEYEDASLNFNWTNGITCSKLFECLTPYEREIIVLSFIEGKSDIEIGEIYGYHRGTINVHKREAVKKVRQEAMRLNII